VRLVAALLILSFAGTARADEAADRAKAQQLAEDALRRINDRGDYAGASDNFLQAYELTRELSYLLNVAVSLRKANLNHQSVAAYRRWLAEGGSTNPLAPQVNADIEAIERDSVIVTVRTEGAPAEIALDLRAVGIASATAPLVVLVNSDAGKQHTLRATRTGFLPTEHPLERLSRGDKIEIVLEPRPNIARITVTSDPAGAEISEATRVIGTAPQSIDLAPGDYEIFGRLRGHTPARERIYVVAGQPQEVTLRLAPIEESWWERHHTKVYVGAAAVVVIAVGAFFIARELKPNYDGTTIVYP
jgi:hypothetical protein